MRCVDSGTLDHLTGHGRVAFENLLRRCTLLGHVRNEIDGNSRSENTGVPPMISGSDPMRPQAC
jgi:hypothetical protein